MEDTEEDISRIRSSVSFHININIQVPLAKMGYSLLRSELSQPRTLLKGSPQIRRLHLHKPHKHVHQPFYNLQNPSLHLSPVCHLMTTN